MAIGASEGVDHLRVGIHERSVVDSESEIEMRRFHDGGGGGVYGIEEAAGMYVAEAQFERPLARKSPTKILPEVESKTGSASGDVLTVTGQPLPMASAGVPVKTPVNLWSFPESSPT